jgi:hypothetical protein
MFYDPATKTCLRIHKKFDFLKTTIGIMLYKVLMKYAYNFIFYIGRFYPSYFFKQDERKKKAHIREQIKIGASMYLIEKKSHYM